MNIKNLFNRFRKSKESELSYSLNLIYLEDTCWFRGDTGIDAAQLVKGIRIISIQKEL